MKNFVVLGFSTILIVLFSNSTALIGESKKIFYSPPSLLKYFTIGYDETISDFFWLRLIQDFDSCGNYSNESNLNPSGVKMGRNRTPTCTKGWSFQMLDTITELAPRNYFPHQIGPLSLSVVADDIEGATIMFEKGMARYPRDWLIHFQAGYHFLLELEDKVSAAKYLSIAARNGGPEYLPLLIARLYSDSGKDLFAEEVLNQYINKTEESNYSESFKNRARMKLDEIKKRRAQKPSSNL